MIYKVLSYAKVNLFLNIIGKTTEGYHNIQSYFILLNLSDNITIHSSHNKSKYTFKNNILIKNNIALKATQYINAIHNSNKFVEIEIQKQIPISSGLGGGSSNCASILHVLPKLWHLPKLTSKQVKEVAYTIGADIPFFYYGKNALVEGIGDKVTPVTTNHILFIILINPGLKVITQEIYSNAPKYFSQKISCNNKDIINEIFFGKNDLESYVIQKYQLIGELLKIIKKQKNCLISRMSGSGSTCYGLFKEKEDVIIAKNNLRKIFQIFWIHYEKIFI